MSVPSMFNITKLDEGNYDSWSLQVKYIMVHQDLWEVVSGKSPKPEMTQENAAKVDQ